MKQTIYILITIVILSCQNSDETVYSLIKSPKTGQLISINLKIDSIDILDLNTNDLRLLRNEIFARHGYTFKSKDLTDYFSKQDWYEPKLNADQIDDKLTDIDQYNIKLIKSIEDKKNYKPIKWETDIQNYLDLIPTIDLPFDFVCEKSFKPAGLDYEIEIIKKYKPDGAAIIAKIYQDENEAALIYGYPADIFFPLISIIDKSGKEKKEIRFFKLSDCVGDMGSSTTTYGTITKDYKIKRKIVDVTWDYMIDNSKKDTTITEDIIMIK